MHLNTSIHIGMDGPFIYYYDVLVMVVLPIHGHLHMMVSFVRSRRPVVTSGDVI